MSLNSRYVCNSLYKSHQENLNQIIEQYCDQASANSTECDQSFYEGFKFQVAHQQISDLISQVERSSKLDEGKRQLSTQILSQAQQILKNYSSQECQIKIKITQSLFNLQRDTIRTIQEVHEAFALLESIKWPCKGPANKQYDKQLRALEKLCYFWEQVLMLENRATSTISTNEFKQRLNQWFEQFTNEIRTKNFDNLKKSKKGYLDTQLRNAHEMYVGLGIEKNRDSALQIYKRLSEESHPIAQAIMGQVLMDGELGEKDYDQAFNYFKLSADQGHTFSVYWASRLILEEKVFDKFFEKDEQQSRKSSVTTIKTKDCDLAIKLLRKAAELNHVPSMIYLGDLYTSGLQLQNYSLEKDYQDAEYFYKQAQKRNSVEATYKLSLLYQEMSKQSLNKNRRQLIFPLLSQAKNQDYLPAFYDLGMLLLNGLGEELQANPIMADLIFEQGAFNGDFKCAKKLLNLRFQNLQREEGQLTDFLSLLDQLEDILKDQTVINYMRGKIYYKGISCEKNLQKAVEQFRIGSWRGCLKCKAQLEKIFKDKEDLPTSSPQSSIQKLNIQGGFIDQVKLSDQRKAYQIQKGKVSLNNKSIPFEQENQSTRQDRHTIMTISIVKPNEANDPDRKRGGSEYHSFKRAESGVMLSQLKLQIQSPQQQSSTRFEQQQQSQYGSPRQPSLINISSNSSKKDLFNFSKFPSHSSINSSKYLFNQP
ncbi:unnamed protein product (macronuclear) [Paramecium tetraurelia]|uniref:Uncharacterized protein n=1 Tax=Paramecium tetraurelia TaxID=5888 RepID=A0DHD2_PARTE|nr:uncharacterized protein GSPATT00016836001 [Paramecium tetraurelia]CAK82449.1 unnamed protein product [Paramecium tetraurelia]|eukprot:XP_001449846.1 hypothetical protein (macronuclear) [Paramecium tetraurelia strain d4-2]